MLNGESDNEGSVSGDVEGDVRHILGYYFESDVA
jgi:hypothetical protein